MYRVLFRHQSYQPSCLRSGVGEPVVPNKRWYSRRAVSSSVCFVNMDEINAFNDLILFKTENVLSAQQLEIAAVSYTHLQAQKTSGNTY